MRSADSGGAALRRASLLAALGLATALAACSGSTGPAGPAGPTGATGATGSTGATGAQGVGLDPVTSTKPESCATCHSAVGQAGHQATYNAYVDKSKLYMKFDSVDVTPPAGAVTTYSAKLNFTLLKNSLPVIDATGIPSMLQKTFYVVAYSSQNRQFLNSKSQSAATVTPSGLNDGKYSLTFTGLTWNPKVPSSQNCSTTATVVPCDGAMFYGYVAQDLLPMESYDGTHYQLYDNMSSAALGFGTLDSADPSYAASTYVSNADVTACEGCHGKPYRKHGYREAIVTNSLTAMPTAANEVVKDFAPCKACHYDNRVGTDKIWQQIVADPLGWATGKAIGSGEYNYTANLMNDTHMSHAMEFAYPQSMAVCSTCHSGAKLANVQADKFFTAQTCKSCHPVTDGGTAYPTEAGRAPSLNAMWTKSGMTFHANYDLNGATDCTTCHNTNGNKLAKPISGYHNGFQATSYTAAIYDTTGKMYSTDITESIDSVSLPSCTAASCVLTIKGSAKSVSGSTLAASVTPTIVVSLYGYDTKNFLISGHSAALNGKRFLEYVVGAVDTVNACTPVAPATTCTTPVLWKTVSNTGGAWEVTADLAVTRAPATTVDTIPNLITAGKVKKAEVVALPALTVSGKSVALNAVTKTIDLTNKAAIVADYYQGANAVVSEAKCNACHDALGSTFHNGAYGGNIVACRACHVPVTGASHLETQSRSIDSYVHAIHAFQAFDVANINFKDPVAAKRYAEHLEHVFPNFTLNNCEGCHVTSKFTNSTSSGVVTYNVPDQSESLPGLISGSVTLKNGWYVLDANGNYSVPSADRKISGVPTGQIPAYATGPASRACGGCHRAEFVNEDDLNGLVSFNQHVNTNGYLVDTSQTSTTWTTVTSYVYGVIDNIMKYF